MSRVKPPVKYQAVSLHVPLLEEIKDHIKDKDRYRSIAEFVRDAIREKIAQGEKENNIERRVTCLEKTMGEFKNDN